MSKWKVTITEKLQKTIVVEADDQCEAEEIVADRYSMAAYGSEYESYILTSDDFTDVSFDAVLAKNAEG